MARHLKTMSAAVAFAAAVMCAGCSSGAPGAPAPARPPSATVTSAPTTAGGVTLTDMCAAFEATAGQNLAKVKQDCATAPTKVQNGNADATQCVVELQVASELAADNTYSQQQAYDACNAYNTSDPAGAQATLPGADKIPLNADHQSLEH